MEQVKPDLENPLSSPMADPKNALADAFIAINNPQERIANLTNLIQALSPWERRHVRMELGDHDDLAGFEDLPVDVVCGIIPYLKIEDVIACSAVSKRCRTSWTEPAVASATSLHFFPALQAPFDFSKFSEVCKKYFVRRAGRFALRVSTSLPFSSNDTLAGVLFSPTLQQWDLDSRRILRPDPVIHPEDEYPPGWLEMLNAKFACYGGGNVVWFGLPDFVVIDNMYKRERRVVNIQAWITPAWTAVSSKALVVVHNVSKNTLIIYDIESNSTSKYHLPSELRSMIVRDRRIFLVLDGMQVCILDHDGSRVLTTHHFKADDDPELFSKFFTNKGIVLIFPHPHDPDRFFLAVQGWLNRNPPDDDDEDEDEHSASEDDVDMEEPTKYLIVMEFAGSCHIATYHEAWPICSVEDEDICFSTEAEVLDDQGTYATGHWSIPRSDERALHFSGLPTPPEGFNYTIQTSFNTVTREFGIQSHLVPATLRAGRCGAPWALQDFIPHVPKPGVLNIRRFDAEDADVYPTRPSRPESKGERADFGRDWTIESSLIDEVMERTCQFFHDEDFTVMFLEESHLLYAWSYVDDKEAWNQARPSSALLEMRGEKPERPSVSFQEIREAISLD